MTSTFAALILLFSHLILHAQSYAIHESCSAYSAQTPATIEEAMEDVKWVVEAGKGNIESEWYTRDNTKRSLFHKEHKEDEEGEENPTVPTEVEIEQLKGK
jgi:hypothetical protein